MSAGLTIVPLFVMLAVGLLGLVAALIYWAFFKGNKRVLRGVGIVCLLIAVVIVGAKFFGVQHAAPRVATAPTPWITPSPANVVIDPFSGADEVLRRIDDQTITRDTYTSIPQLTAAMVAKVEAACEKLGDGKPRRIVAIDVSADIVKTVSEGIDAKPFDSNDPQVVDHTEDQTWVNLGWQNRVRHQPAWSRTTLVRGQLVAKINGAKGASQVMLTLDEKPWLSETPDIPGSDYTVVTYSEPSTTREQAIANLDTNVLNQLTNAVTSRAGTTMASPPNSAQVFAQVSDAIARRQFLADRVLIGIDRPVGRVWYAAALIDQQPQLIDQVAQRAASLSYERRTTWATLALAFGGMLLVLAVVYAGLNAVTRGYLRGRLIAGMAVAAAVLVVTIVLFLG